MKATPQRLRLSRRRGFRLQHESLVVNGLAAAKVTRPGPFGNPWRVTGRSDPGNLECATAKEAVARFKEDRGTDEGFIKNVLPELRGKNLACFCPVWHCKNGHKFGHEFSTPRLAKKCPECGLPLVRFHCHADVLLDLANR